MSLRPYFKTTCDESLQLHNAAPYLSLLHWPPIDKKLLVETGHQSELNFYDFQWIVGTDDMYKQLKFPLCEFRIGCTIDC